MRNTARLNLTASAFPLLSTHAGNGILARHEYDTNHVIQNQFGGTESDRDVGIPQHIYMHNVMPTTYGVKSIGYKKEISGLGSSYRHFDKIFLLRSEDETKVFFSPARGRNYILGAANPNNWISFPFPALHNGNVTHAYVNGKTYVCYERQGIYEYNAILNTFTLVNPIGIVGTSVHGVCNANNYMIVWDSTTVYWSSAIDALEFTPSLSTTSGSGKVQAARGAIVCCLPIHDGFIVYTTANAIVGSFSGNARFPWNFREIPGSAGITDSEHVTYDTNYDSHFAWTTSGMLQIDKQRAIPIWPAVTDFLTERTIEYDIPHEIISNFTGVWNSESQILSHKATIENLLTSVTYDDNLRVKLTFLGARYVVISYGPPKAEEFLYALIYDIALARWGKIKIPHIDLFTWVKPNYKYNIIEPKKSFGVLSLDGQISTVDFAANTIAEDTLYVYGRIKPRRNNTWTLQTVNLSNIQRDSNFSLEVYSSTASKLPVKRAVPVLTINNELARRYNMRTTGVEHLLVMRGTFDLVNLDIEFADAGNR